MPVVLQPQAGTIQFTDMLARVLPNAPSCPDDTAVFHLREAAIEFCRRTTVWRSFQGQINTIADITAYEFVLEPGQRVVKLLSLQLDGIDVNVVKPEKGLQMVQRGMLGPFAFGALTSFELHPAQEPDLVLLPFSAVMPSSDSDGIPEVLERYLDPIASGALSRLLAMKADWRDPEVAGIHATKFNSAIATAARAAHSGHSKQRRDPSTRFY